MLAGRDAALLHTLGLTPAALQQQLVAHTAAAKWSSMTAEDKQKDDEQQWRVWLNRYQARLQQEANEGGLASGASDPSLVCMLFNVVNLFYSSQCAYSTYSSSWMEQRDSSRGIER